MPMQSRRVFHRHYLPYIDETCLMRTIAISRLRFKPRRRRAAAVADGDDYAHEGAGLAP